MDLIIKNAKIATMNFRKPFATAAAVEDGKFIRVGNDDEVLKLSDPNTKVLDLQGKLVVPGFNDSHMHLLSYGFSLRRVVLTGAGSIDEIILRVKNFINDRKIKTSEWIEGIGWNQDYFNEKRFPTRYDLDKISMDHPICVVRACYHIAVVNSKALSLMGVTSKTPQVEGGKFDKDENGEPLGIFRENAVRLIYEKIPEPSLEDIKDIIKEAVAIASSKGITSIQTDDFEHIPSKDYQKIIQAYKELDEEKKLNVRINEQCLLPSLERLKKFLNDDYVTGKGNEFFKVGPLKLLTDGSLGARTALLSKPYEDEPSTTGISVFTQEQLDELVLKAHKAEMQIAIHCIGDKAMHMALDSIEKAQKEYYRKDARHSIIHCQITDDTLLKRFKDLDIIAHIQPIFLDYDLHIVEDRVGVERSKTSYNWKKMYELGIHVACGSDCPVEKFDVLPNIYCAVTRKDLKGNPDNGWLPEQKLTLDEALYGFTLGGAYASFEENIKGSITEGKYADLVVLSEDIYSIEPDRIKDIEVEMTVIGGNIVYKR